MFKAGCESYITASLMTSDMTTRERIINLLQSHSNPLSAEEIILVLNLQNMKPRDIYEHLKHIAKSVKARSGGKEVLAMIPPSCKSCGYIFEALDKPKKPSKCPKCKSERISTPTFKLVSTY
ncbi:MAG: transcriptional regulator [Candidatus Nezhaarchaeota archaeon]|nr:transcriptional regulator [Candidatus Nezhaarchaeota archaeon]